MKIASSPCLKFGAIQVLYRDQDMDQAPNAARRDFYEMALHLTGKDADRFQRISAQLPPDQPPEQPPAQAKEGRIAHFQVFLENGEVMAYQMLTGIREIVHFEAGCWGGSSEWETPGRAETQEIEELLDMVQSSPEIARPADEPEAEIWCADILSQLGEALKQVPFLGYALASRRAH